MVIGHLFIPGADHKVMVGQENDAAVRAFFSLEPLGYGVSVASVFIGRHAGKAFFDGFSIDGFHEEPPQKKRHPKPARVYTVLR